ncbi:MAG: SEC59/DGK1/VTE5 family protein [Candidatus Bathyarchaeota archaeon]|nr:SEC59/DGK1/VTE5 family protein [Candidatus Bathyarchaeota archaeon]
MNRGTASLREILTRKGLHSLGAFILVILDRFGLRAAQAVIIVMLGLYAISELLRRSGGDLPLFTSITRAATSESDREGVVSAPIWFALGTLLSITLFPFRYATIGVLTVSVGDPVAALAGQFLGRHPNPLNRSKSVEGSLAGFAASALICSLLTDPAISVVGCLVGMIVEALPLPMNDNFTVPILSALSSFVAAVSLG